jgi:hypothetical protein
VWGAAGGGWGELKQHDTNARRNSDIFASRTAGNGARIRNLHAESSRNQASLLILVHTHASSQATLWGHHDGGTKVHPGQAKPDSACYRRLIENPLSLMLLGDTVQCHPINLWESDSEYALRFPPRGMRHFEFVRHPSPCRVLRFWNGRPEWRP